MQVMQVKLATDRKCLTLSADSVASCMTFAKFCDDKPNYCANVLDCKMSESHWHQHSAGPKFYNEFDHDVEPSLIHGYTELAVPGSRAQTYICYGCAGARLVHDISCHRKHGMSYRGIFIADVTSSGCTA